MRYLSGLKQVLTNDNSPVSYVNYCQNFFVRAGELPIVTQTGPPDDGNAATGVTRRHLFAAIGISVATAGCNGLQIGTGSSRSFDTPQSVVSVYLQHHPLATSMSPEEYSERARAWWHSRTRFFNGLEEAMSNPFGGEGDSESRTTEIIDINTSVRNLSTEQLLGLDPNVGVSGSIGDFADEETALVDALWRFESSGGAEYSSEVNDLLDNQIRYLTAIEDDEWQILTSI